MSDNKRALVSKLTSLPSELQAELIFEVFGKIYLSTLMADALCEIPHYQLKELYDKYVLHN